MGIAEIEFIRSSAIQMLVLLILFGIIGVVVHLLMNYKDAFRKNKWLRTMLPVAGVGVCSALAPFLVVLQQKLDDLLRATVSNPYDFDFAYRTLGFPWRLILWIRGEVLNQVYIVGICIATGIVAYFLTGFIISIIQKIKHALA